MSMANKASTDTNILSNSLLSDSAFWKNFLEEDCVVLNNSVKSKEGNITMPIIVQSPKTEKMDFRINNNMLVSLCETSNVVNETPTNLADQYLYSSKSKQKRNELHTYNRKRYKYSKILPNLFPNSYLYKIKQHIEKYVENTVPILTVKDISKAKQYSIFNELVCRNLYEIRGIIFKKVKCRGTLVGFIKRGEGYQLLVDDGTSSMWCYYDSFFNESDNVDNFPMIKSIDSHPVTASFNFKRGTILQLLGTLDIYRRKFLIKKLCSEEDICVSRELLYLQHIQSLNNMYAKWKQDISNIYNIQF